MLPQTEAVCSVKQSPQYKEQVTPFWVTVELLVNDMSPFESATTTIANDTDHLLYYKTLLLNNTTCSIEYEDN